jgi:hypothetical protein
MIVITAPHLYIPKYDDVTVFLAGGITGCRDWQNETIEHLRKFVGRDDTQVVVYNPRQEDFDINNPAATIDQITWEYQYLNQVDIFSMYFVGGDRIQPICMYELGRYMKPHGDQQVISVEMDYIRKNDVIIQVALATRGITTVNAPATPYYHAKHIFESIEKVKERKMGRPTCQ